MSRLVSIGQGGINQQKIGNQVKHPNWFRRKIKLEKAK